VLLCPIPELQSYRTLSSRSEGEYREKGSKFLAFAFPAESEEEVQDRLTDIRKEFHDARHHCYAYRLGNKGETFRANDDGEPNHSAGDPILGQLRSFNLTNSLVVVVRYFGGTKLGVSGLINAYRTAAEEALRNGRIREVAVTVSIDLEYPYESTNEVMRLISDFSATVSKQQFTDKCFQTVEVNVALVKEFREKVALLINTGTSIEIS
jgi:uncharacterized YigZ family protein